MKKGEFILGITHICGLLACIAIVGILLLISEDANASDTMRRTEEVGITGSESAIVYDAVECYEYGKYFVVRRSFFGSSGNDILVKKKEDYENSIECSYVVGRNDFEVKNEDADYFFGIYQDLMFVDSGTCPCPRGLSIYSLTERKMVYESTYMTPIAITPDSKLSFWMETAEVATPENCPNYDNILQGHAGIDKRVTLDLKTFELAESDETRCVYHM